MIKLSKCNNLRSNFKEKLKNCKPFLYLSWRWELPGERTPALADTAIKSHRNWKIEKQLNFKIKKLKRRERKRRCLPRGRLLRSDAGAGPGSARRSICGVGWNKREGAMASGSGTSGSTLSLTLSCCRLRLLCLRISCSASALLLLLRRPSLSFFLSFFLRRCSRLLDSAWRPEAVGLYDWVSVTGPICHFFGP